MPPWMEERLGSARTLDCIMSPVPKMPPWMEERFVRREEESLPKIPATSEPNLWAARMRTSGERTNRTNVPGGGGGGAGRGARVRELVIIWGAGGGELVIIRTRAQRTAHVQVGACDSGHSNGDGDGRDGHSGGGHKGGCLGDSFSCSNLHGHKHDE